MKGLRSEVESQTQMDFPSLNTPCVQDEESEGEAVEYEHDNDIFLPLELSHLREAEGSSEGTCQPEESAQPGRVVSPGRALKPGEVDLLLHTPAFEEVPLPPLVPPPPSDQMDFSVS